MDKMIRVTRIEELVRLAKMTNQEGLDNVRVVLTSEMYDDITEDNEYNMIIGTECELVGIQRIIECGKRVRCWIIVGECTDEDGQPTGILATCYLDDETLMKQEVYIVDNWSYEISREQIINRMVKYQCNSWTNFDNRSYSEILRGGMRGWDEYSDQDPIKEWEEFRDEIESEIRDTAKDILSDRFGEEPCAEIIGEVFTEVIDEMDNDDSDASMYDIIQEVIDNKFGEEEDAWEEKF